MRRSQFEPRVDAAILAGGRARRLGGADKALVEVGGRRIVDRQLAVLAPLFGEVLLVVDAPARLGEVAGVRRVVDERPGEGPLAALASALGAARGDALVVVGCDLPFLDERLLALLRDRAPDAEALVPRVGGRAQPLCARYRRSARAAALARLDRGERRLVALLDDLAVAYVEEPELRTLDPTLRTLTNVNTPEELTRARDG
jgi:molybdopterin-guanine dinucleotide biosynthesis protein A